MNAIKETTIHIAPPNIQMGEVWIKGTAPLVMHKFSHLQELADVWAAVDKHAKRCNA